MSVRRSSVSALKAKLEEGFQRNPLFCFGKKDLLVMQEQLKQKKRDEEASSTGSRTAAGAVGRQTLQELDPTSTYCGCLAYILLSTPPKDDSNTALKAELLAQYQRSNFEWWVERSLLCRRGMTSTDLVATGASVVDIVASLKRTANRQLHSDKLPDDLKSS